SRDSCAPESGTRLMISMDVPRWGRVSSALLGPLGETAVVVGDPQHHLLRRLVTHLLRERARFFCAPPPLLGIVDEGTRHGSLVSAPPLLPSASHRQSIGPISAASQGSDVEGARA